MTAPEETPRPRDARFLALAFLLALGMRLLPLPAATNGGLRLLSPDCYGHLRRSELTARRFPRVPIHDAYLNHPDGAVWIWAPFLDLVIGGTARALFGSRPAQADVMAVAAWVPPVLGALHVLPLSGFARRAIGRRRARIAVLAYAVLPGAILWSSFGHADHHVAEALALLVFLWTAARVLDRPPGRRTGRLVIAGLALAFTMLVWHGAVFVAVLALPWALLFLGPGAGILGVTAAAATALQTYLFLPAAKVPFSFVSFGWFQPLLVAAGALPLAAWAALRARGRARAAALAASAVLLAVTLPHLPRLLGAAFRGGGYVFTQAGGAGRDDFADGGYLSYPPELMKMIAEAQPLLAPRWASLAHVTAELSPGFVLLPLALLLWAWPLVSRRRAPATPASTRRRAVRALLVLFAGALLVMALFQRRNVYYVGIFSALALAELVARALPRRPRLVPRLAAAAALLLVVLPGLPELRRIRAYAYAPGHDVLALFTRLGALDPPPVDPLETPPAPGRLAGILPPWAAGHFATALARRPSAADPFQYGWRRECRIYTAPDDAEPERLLREARCRYLVTTDMRGVLAGYASAVGRENVPPDAMFIVRVHESMDEHPAPFLTLVLTSRTAARGPDGRLVPRFKIYRVEGVDDLPR